VDIWKIEGAVVRAALRDETGQAALWDRATVRKLSIAEINASQYVTFCNPATRLARLLHSARDEKNRVCRIFVDDGYA